MNEEDDHMSDIATAPKCEKGTAMKYYGIQT